MNFIPFPRLQLRGRRVESYAHVSPMNQDHAAKPNNVCIGCFHLSTRHYCVTLVLPVTCLIRSMHRTLSNLRKHGEEQDKTLTFLSLHAPAPREQEKEKKKASMHGSARNSNTLCGSVWSPPMVSVFELGSCKMTKDPLKLWISRDYACMPILRTKDCLSGIELKVYVCRC